MVLAGPSLLVSTCWPPLLSNKESGGSCALSKAASLLCAAAFCLRLRHASRPKSRTAAAPPAGTNGLASKFSRKEGSGAGGGGGAGRFFGSGLGLGCSSAVGAVGISACGGDVGVSTAGPAGRFPGTATLGVAVPAAPAAAPAPAAPALSASTVPAVLC